MNLAMFLESVKKYSFKTGIFNIHPVNDSSNYEDNPLLFTAEMHWVANKIGIDREFYSDYDIMCAKFEKWISDCKVNIEGRQYPGLYNRRPDYWVRLISHDEMIGLISFNKALAEDIYNYGKSNFWSWDNRCPKEWTPRSYQDRLNYVVAFYTAAAGKDIGIVRQIRYLLDALYTGFFSKGSSTELLYILQFDIMGNSKHWLIRKSIQFLKYRFTKRFGDISGLFKTYFNQYDDFPLVVYTKGLAF